MIIAGYEFNGPWVLPTTLSDRPGVYVVLCESCTGYRVLEVGESTDVLRTLDDRDRRCCASIYCSGSIRFAAHYCDASACARVITAVTHELKPPCGRVYSLAGNRAQSTSPLPASGVV